MIDPETGQIWTLASDPDAFRLVEFDDGSVLFDHRDGQTHFLNPVACAVWRRLSARESGTRELVGHIEHRFDAALTDEEQADVLRILHQLHALKLIRCRQASET